MSRGLVRSASHDYKLQDVGCINSQFLDSGSFSIWKKVATPYAKEHRTDQWGYYHTKDFYRYMDEYAAFVKKFHEAIDLYANVDVIPNPELTWRNQRYLEKQHGLTPVPIVHYKTDLKWLKHYLDKGYGMIGLGGLVGSAKQSHARGWIDQCFDIVCDTPDRMPRVKLHGFGITTYSLMLRYPWFSVDSASWTKSGAFGSIYVPHKRHGKFVFDVQPYVIKISLVCPERQSAKNHFLNIPPAEKKIILEWLEEIDIPLGTWDKAGKPIEQGVVTHNTWRKAANLLFFERVQLSLPKWPWSWRSVRRKGFGLFSGK